MPGFQAARDVAALEGEAPRERRPSRGFAQGSLFEPSLHSPAPAEGSGPTFSRLERIDLGGGAWVDHCQCWVSHPAPLFRLVKEETAWQAHTRVMYERRVAVPRLVG